MSESGPGKELPPKPNRVSDYVVKHVRRFKDLDGDTPEDRDSNFIRVLKSIIPKSKLDGAIGHGGNFNVFPLLRDKDVVVKQLITGDYETVAERNAEWDSYKKEHNTALSYFGRRFIPYTEFLDETFRMVQERAPGTRYSEVNTILPVSPQLKAEMIEFMRRYERMMREEGSVLERPNSELMIDYEKAKITVLDTNGFLSLRDVEGDVVEPFLHEFHIDPKTLKTSTDIIQTLVRVLPEAASLEGASYETAMDKLCFGELWGSVFDRLFDHFGPDVGDGFHKLVTIADAFPPEGHHPRVITKMMQRFGIVDTDLIPT